jgi:hypothetical protein
MKTRSVFLTVLLTLCIISCKKETFPDNEDLKGNWAEISTLMDQEGLYFDGVETLYWTRIGSRYIKMDTLFYRLDKKHEKLYLHPVTSPGSSESVHKIQVDTVNNELTIWGLHDSASSQKFKKQ